MASTIATIATYALNGSNKRFTIPYEYLARRFIEVTLFGDERRLLVLNVDYRFTSATRIETTVPWGGSNDGYTNIELRRNTSATDRLVDFSDGSVLRSRDLNLSAIQTLHIAEEARNMAGETLAENDDGNLDARFRKVVNVKDGTQDKDAINYGQVVEWNDSAYNSRIIAIAKAGEASTSASQALQYRNTAGTHRNDALTFRNTAEAAKNASGSSETNANTYANNALAFRNTTLTYRNTAGNSATDALAYRNTALQHRNAAASSETRAQQWAEQPVNVEVITGKYSAMHWAMEAEGSVQGTNYMKKSANLSDVSNAITARVNLGLGNAATKDVGEGVGKVLTQGNYGVGKAKKITGNLDNTIVEGTYCWDQPMTNAPVRATYAHMTVTSWGDGAQQTVRVSSGEIWYRNKVNSVTAWSPWERVVVMGEGLMARLQNLLDQVDAQSNAIVFTKALAVAEHFYAGTTVSATNVQVRG